jgi:hypothetical protein
MPIQFTSIIRSLNIKNGIQNGIQNNLDETAVLEVLYQIHQSVLTPPGEPPPNPNSGGAGPRAGALFPQNWGMLLANW